MTTCVKGRSLLHKVAVRWLMDRANPESQGGLGVFADTRYCDDLTTLLERVYRRGVRAGRESATKAALDG